MLSASAGFIEFAITLSCDLLIQDSQLVSRGDIVDGTVQAYVIVMFNKLVHSTLRIFLGCRASGANALLFETAVKALQLAVALRIVRTRANVAEPEHTYE